MIPPIIDIIDSLIAGEITRERGALLIKVHLVEAERRGLREAYNRVLQNGAAFNA